MISLSVDYQISGHLKDNEKINTSPATTPTDDDSEIKKIKKVHQHPDKNHQIQRQFHPTGNKTVKHLNCCNNIHNIHLLLSNYLSNISFQ